MAALLEDPCYGYQPLPIYTTGDPIPGCSSSGSDTGPLRCSIRQRQRTVLAKVLDSGGTGDPPWLLAIPCTDDDLVH